jgi:predicted exporter
VAIWLAVRLADGPSIRTDLMALLPVNQLEPTVSNVVSDFQKRFERRVVLLVSAPDAAAAEQAATYVYDAVLSSGRFDSLQLRRDEDTLRDAASFYVPLRYELLSRRARERLAAGEWDAFERDVLARYYGPVGVLGSDLVRVDPMFVLLDALGDRLDIARGNLQVVNGYLTVADEDGVHILIDGVLAGSPFAFDLQNDIAPVLKRLRAELPTLIPDATLFVGGVLPHAIAGTERAQSEVSLVGTGSLIGIIALFLIVFRRTKPLLLSLFSIGVGVACGYAACLIGFGGIHLITMVFGASLIGISVDYSLHFFCERFGPEEPWSADRAVKDILPGITIGLITSIIGFLGLSIGPFPGMREMAVFSSVGLACAYANVVLLYPLIAVRIPRPPSDTVLRIAMGYSDIWRKRPSLLFGVLAAALIVGAGGMFLLQTSDDIRLMQPQNDQIRADEAALSRIIGRDIASQFLLISADNDEDLLRAEESAIEQLYALEADGKLGGHLALSDMFPSQARRQQDRQLIGALIDGRDSVLNEVAGTVGLPADVVQSYVDEFARTAKAPSLTLGGWLADPASEPFRDLYVGRIGDSVYSVVSLSGIEDLSALGASIGSLPPVRLIDTPGMISALFGSYRDTAGWMILASYGLVLVVLALRYGVIGAILTILPPAAGSVATLGLLGLLGEDLTLFTILPLLVVLGVGIDYAIFSREKGQSSAPTQLAIGLSLLTNVLGYGLLGFSTTKAIHDFGLTVFIGTSMAWLLAPIASMWRDAPKGRI